MYSQPPPGYGQQPYGQQPGYGQPPGYYQQPPPQQPVIIVQNNQNQPTIQNITRMGSISKCEMCQRETDNVQRPKIGCVTIAWCCCLFYFTGVLCWIPCCVDSCKDTEFVCQSCGLVKTTIPANCC